jgi:hypothetical protein
LGAEDSDSGFENQPNSRDKMARLKNLDLKIPNIELPIGRKLEEPLHEVSADVLEEILAIDAKMGRDLDHIDEIKSSLGIVVPAPTLVVELNWDTDKGDFNA